MTVAQRGMLCALGFLLFCMVSARAQILPFLSNPPVGPGSIVPIGPSAAASTAPPPIAGALLLEDGSSILLLEDGSSHFCLEGGC